MEIAELRQELNDLLENVVEHSQRYSGNRPIPSLEISFVFTKINKMQETLIILKYLLKEEEKQKKKASIASREEKPANLVEEKIEEVITQTEKVIEEIVEPIIEEKIEKKEEDSEIENEATEKNNGITVDQLPIAKLADSFSLNDRYLFANELFDKDMSAFNETVKSIDVSADFEEAKAILLKQGTDRGWDLENENVLAFTNLVERRFL